MPYFDQLGSGVGKPGDLNLEGTFGQQVHVQPVLARLGFRHLHEVQRSAIPGWVADSELAGIPLADVVLKRLCPPLSLAARVAAVNDQTERAQPSAIACCRFLPAG